MQEIKLNGNGLADSIYFFALPGSITKVESFFPLPAEKEMDVQTGCCFDTGLVLNYMWTERLEAAMNAATQGRDKPRAILCILSNY